MRKGGPEKHGEIIETIYRESHSLKGAACSVNRSDIVAICQALENTFSALKREEIVPSSRILDLLHQTVDRASDLIIGMEISQADKFGAGGIIHKLEEATLQKQSVSGREERAEIRPDSPAGEQEKPKEKTPEVDSIPKSSSFIHETPPPAVPAPSSAGTIRISTAKLDALLLKAEEMLAVKLSAGQLALELKMLKDSFKRWKKEREKKESFKTALGREILGKAGAEDAAGPFLTSFEAGLTNLIKAAEYDRRSNAVMVDALLDDMKKTLMLPFSSFLEEFPKVRARPLA